MKNCIKKRIPALVLFFLSACLYIWVYFQWGRCPEVDCTENFIDNWLRTIKAGSVCVMGYSILLFLFPTYFKKWFKYVFSWGFPLVVYLTWITTGSSSIPAYGKADIVRFWGIFFGVVTVLFVAVNLYLDRRKNKNKNKF